MAAEPPDESYTVGWICVLQTELAAAQDILEKKYPRRPGRGHDQNIYTPGKIGHHNVVVAALPMGWRGNNPAVMVATRMMAKFPNIRIGLLVGIGGGLPQKGSDIRLGDIVVSKPDGQFSAVVQYDMGRHTEKGFVRTGALNAPPEKLLAVLNYMPLHGRPLDDCPSTLLARYPGEGLDESYKEEDPREPVRGDSGKRDGGPHIFYGTIASGNSIIKEDRKRQMLIKDGVLCCETEAAGLMNSPFPCLVIRGICDFADSHGNDSAWQDYAARTAAQCARQFLNNFPEEGVSKLKLIKGTQQISCGHGKHFLVVGDSF
jgi:nucleoside phosphorylase